MRRFPDCQSCGLGDGYLSGISEDNVLQILLRLVITNKFSDEGVYYRCRILQFVQTQQIKVQRLNALCIL
jgi:hypothetical protein